MEEEITGRRSRLDELSEEERKNEMALLRVTERAKEIDFGIIGFATSDDRDDLKEVEGIGPFIEEKLNALGIYKFSQISMMNSDLEDKVNDAIEFFPGRIKRDKWVDQAKVLAGGAQESVSREGSAGARALLHKKAERRRSMEMAERTLIEAQRREEEARKVAERESKEVEEKAVEIEREAEEARAMLRKKAERRKAEKARAREELKEQQAAEEEAKKEVEREAERKAAEIEREAERKAAEIEREAERKAAEIEREAMEKKAAAKELLRKKAGERKSLEEEGGDILDNL
jgi:predicted flap endonuclease-1-like 5' DNA nuclease